MCILEDEDMGSFQKFESEFGIRADKVVPILVVRRPEGWLQSRLRTGNYSFSTVNLELLNIYVTHHHAHDNRKVS